MTQIALSVFPENAGLVKERKVSNRLSYKSGSRSGVRYSITLNGNTYPSMSAASKMYGIEYNCVKRRLQRGWSIEEAFGLVKRGPTQASRLKEKEWRRIEETGQRVCKRCKNEKPISAFPKHNTCVGGVSPVCRACKTHAVRKTRYGVSEEEYARLLESQGGKCAICRSPDPETRKGVHPDMAHQFCVDHDHSTGAVRGLLCMSCNVGLGKFKDEEKRLEAAIQYLKAAKDPNSPLRLSRKRWKCSGTKSRA